MKTALPASPQDARRALEGIQNHLKQKEDMKATVPPSIEDAKSSLDNLSGMITAYQWERAAIVYAFTTDEIKGGPRTAVKSPQLSARQFADLDIAGLRSDQTVRRYREAWQAAVDAEKTVPVAPGDEVDLPEDEWDLYFPKVGAGRNVQEERREALTRQAEEDGVGKSKVIDVASNPRAMSSAIKADEKSAQAAIDALLSSRKGRAAVARAQRELHDEEETAADEREKESPIGSKLQALTGYLASIHYLHLARDRVKEAIQEADEVSLTDDQQRAIRDAAAEVTTALGWLDTLLNGGITEEQLARLLGTDD